MMGPVARYVPETGPFSHAISIRSAAAMVPEIKSWKFLSELLFGSRRFWFLNWTDFALNWSKKIEASVVEMSRIENWIDDSDGSNKTRNEVASTEMVSSESNSAGNVTVMWYDREAPILPTEEDAGVCTRTEGHENLARGTGARTTRTHRQRDSAAFVPLDGFESTVGIQAFAVGARFDRDVNLAFDPRLQVVVVVSGRVLSRLGSVSLTATEEEDSPLGVVASRGKGKSRERAEEERVHLGEAVEPRSEFVGRGPRRSRDGVLEVRGSTL